jgi:gamma-glutamylcysteine synthetase
MLTEMEDNAESFYGFAQRLSKKHQRLLLERDISDERRAQFDQLIAKSHEDFAALSNQDSESFDQFLENYFAQTYAAVKTES